MDWATGLGLIMGALATADLAYKYGSRVLEKICQFRRVREQTTSQIFSKKGPVTTTFKKMTNERSRPRSTSLGLIEGSYTSSVKVRPGYSLDVAVRWPQLKKS